MSSVLTEGVGRGGPECVFLLSSPAARRPKTLRSWESSGTGKGPHPQTIRRPPAYVLSASQRVPRVECCQGVGLDDLRPRRIRRPAFGFLAPVRRSCAGNAVEPAAVWQ